MTRILVVRYRFIGDTILTIPFLRNLRRAYPDAQIDMLVGPVSGDVLIECPYIDNLITFDTTRKHKYESTPKAKQNFFSYVKLLKEQKYDKAYVLKRSLSSAVLVFLAGIKERIGFNTEHRGILLTKRVQYIKNKHEIECFLDILRADNVPVTDNYLENWIPEDSRVKIDRILEDFNIKEVPKILIHATSGNPKKEWQPEKFAEVIKYLINQKGAQIFYTGTEKDDQMYEKIHASIEHKLIIEPVNLCGKLSIQDSMALISRMNFVVGVDSGTLHIAAAMNTPVIGIYGPMNPEKWKAWGDIHTALYSNIPCVPCDLRSKKCPEDNACLKNITPDMVIQKCNDQLDKMQNVV
ncbi:MAG: lipopolysaccharide heptosyltransferase II [Candidatus Melainabacteria bacterium GWF2_32_7]|nr:MAG: lipopolysaccharide heptosyltransferase II [Candidatus Melainabacteria bacterium GWF2_32_7]